MRQNFNDGQEITYEDLNAIPKGMEKVLFDMLIFELVQAKTDAFFGTGLLSEYATANSVTVRAGVGFQYDVTQVDPEPVRQLLQKKIQTTLNITAPHPSLDRIDLVICKAAVTSDASADRKYKAPAGMITTESMVIRKDWNATVEIFEGTAAATPSVPSTPAGYIKLAEIYVTAVTGIAGAGAVTDSRVILPYGPNILMNTLGYTRLPAAAESNLQALLTLIDGYLTAAKNNYADFMAITSPTPAPGNPASGWYREYFLDGTKFFKDSAGVVTPLGSGGGGGGGASWCPASPDGPVEDEENGEKVLLFEAGAGQKASLFVKVPQSYVSGRQIKMYLGHYSPAASGTQLLSSTSYLVRKNQDAITATANSRASTNTALTNTLASMLRETILDITDTTGHINGVAVTGGDVIKVVLTRGTDTDTEDIRFIANATEVKLA